MVASTYPGMAALLSQPAADPDILDKFTRVAATTANIEDNRARENARENIRKKLAMEAGREKQDSCDLQICFMNEIASDDEEEGEAVVTAAEAIVRANISQKAGQIIVPMAGRGGAPRSRPAPPPSREEAFHSQVWGHPATLTLHPALGC